MSIESAREALLLAFENTVGVTFPKVYRMFLIVEGGRTPKPNSFRLGNEAEAWETEVSFFGLQTGAYSLYSVSENFKEYQGRIPHHLVPIGGDPGGNLICMSIGQKTFGQIFFAHHDFFTYGSEEPDDYGIEYLSDSFESFLGGLGEYSEGWN